MFVAGFVHFLPIVWVQLFCYEVCDCKRLICSFILFHGFSKLIRFKMERIILDFLLEKFHSFCRLVVLCLKNVIKVLMFSCALSDWDSWLAVQMGQMDHKSTEIKCLESHCHFPCSSISCLNVYPDHHSLIWFHSSIYQVLLTNLFCQVILSYNICYLFITIFKLHLSH